MFCAKKLSKEKLPLVILHIGTVKTGTTTIQEFIHQNRSGLALQNLITVEGFGKKNNHDFVSFFEKAIGSWARRRRIRTQEQKEEYFSSFESRFLREITLREKRIARERGAVLITSEHFSADLRTREELESIKDFLGKYFHSIKVIGYFRPQVEMAVSLYSEKLKGQGIVPLERHLANCNPDNWLFNFHKIAKLWSSVFGKQNLHLRIFARTKMIKGDIRHDFLDALSAVGCPINLDSLSFDQKPANESLFRLQGSVFRAINEVVPYWPIDPRSGVNPDNQRLKKAIMPVSGLSIERFFAEDPESIQNRFIESNRLFLDEFLPGQEFVLEQKQDEKDSISLDSAEQMVYELTKILLSEKVNTGRPILEDLDADNLRDISIRILDQKQLEARDAVKLLELATRARPEGPLIQKLLKRAMAESVQKER